MALNKKALSPRRIASMHEGMRTLVRQRIANESLAETTKDEETLDAALKGTEILKAEIRRLKVKTPFLAASAASAA